MSDLELWISRSTAQSGVPVKVIDNSVLQLLARLL